MIHPSWTGLQLPTVTVLDGEEEEDVAATAEAVATDPELMPLEGACDCITGLGRCLGLSPSGQFRHTSLSSHLLEWAN
jgi:hypothetical protein